ncbi:hypothetical protein PCAR4_150072 [Paraburkholderia caribensis]|nr:hypothetical protein PCAR4_150072 [Paraburkholderia caribensis]
MDNRKDSGVKRVWTRCGRKRGNSTLAHERKKLFIELHPVRTLTPCGYASGKTLIRFGKPVLSTEKQFAC